MTTIGFVVETLSSLKMLGPVMDEARSKNVRVAVFIPAWRKGKPYDTAQVDMFIDPVYVYESGSLATAVQKTGISKLVLLNPYRNFVQDIPQLAAAHVAVFSLDYFANSLYVAAAHDNPAAIEQSLGALTKRFVASTFWRDLEFQVRPRHRHYEDKYIPIGNPLIDVFPAINQHEARKKLSLPLDKPILSVFTPNIRDHQAYLFYGLATKYLLKRLARLLRAYCDERGYLLVVKSREKQWDAEPFLSLADRTIYDLPGQHHPSTSALLVRTSTLAVHFGSMMVLEAAGAHVPSIAIAPQAIDTLHGYMRPVPRRMLHRALLAGEPNTLFSSPLVSQWCKIGVKPSRFAATADSMIRSARDEEATYNQFNQTFSGWQQSSTASARIVSTIINYRATGQHQQSAKLAAAKKIAVP